MYSTDAMEYGSHPMPFRPDADFTWVYPSLCGYDVARESVAVCAQEGGLLVCILRGTGAARRAGEARAYRPGCAVVARRAAELTLCPEEETEYLYLLLQNADGLLERIGRSGFVQTPPADSRADRMLGRICFHAAGGRTGGVCAASADAYALLMELCGHCGETRAAISPLVRQAIALMREDFAFLAGVDELADRLGVSKSHLIRVFSETVGTPPGKYLQSVKLDNAKLMLQNRDYSVEMVADMTGYAGANYFCKVFRRATGESPGEYRARRLAPPALDAESRRRLEGIEGILHV